jgi:hypothetical protein
MNFKNETQNTKLGSIIPFDVFEASREERIKKRKEKKFLGDDNDKKEESEEDTESSGEGSFKLNTFIDAVTGIKNQIISQLGECDSRIIAKDNLGGGKSSEKFKKLFLKQLERAAALLAEATEKRKEGRKLKDEKLIAGFRNNYKQLSEDVTKASNDYTTEKDAEITDNQQNIKNKEIVASIGASLSSFKEASDMLANYLQEYVKDPNFKSNKKPEKKAEEKTDAKDEVKASDIKIEAPIKKWESGKPANDNAKKVQQLIIDKFKNNKAVSDTDLYKKFTKSGADGKNGKLTSSLIIMLKKGFGMKDTSSDITQDFVNELSALKEGLLIESKKILSFNDFMGINEAFDSDAFTKAYTEYKSTSGDKKESGDKKSEGEGTGFTNKEEGDEFRKWVNDKHSDWAKENKLDVTGSYDNSFIRKAWSKFKDAYKKPEDEKEVSTVSVEDISKKLKGASDAIVKLFDDASFWEEFKGKVNDDEEEAVVAFNDWYDTVLKKKFLNTAKDMIDKLDDGDDKEGCTKNYNILISAQKAIKNKLYGDTDNNTFSWKMYPMGEESDVKSYKVDTDF